MVLRIQNIMLLKHSFLLVNNSIRNAPLKEGSLKMCPLDPYH